MNPEEFAHIAASEQRFWWFRGMRRILYRMLDPVARTRRIECALEAGCGTGYMARLLEQRYGWRVHPVDYGLEGLRFGHSLGVRRMVQADISRLPFPEGAFEAVLSLDVLVHFPWGEEEAAVRELARVLSPGGLLVLRVSALDILRSRHSEFAFERQRFTRRRLARVVERSGFRVLRSTYANSLLTPVALAKFRLWEPLLRRPPASGIEGLPGWLDKLLYLPLACEAEWIGAGLGFPLGQSLILIGERA
ncbi:MAG: class I SAM-dependent methyltransferase [Acidobacteria bacterium]|nr:class I SAM-dependent methyltransferase [Acidobacteriota bacterium]